MLPITSPNPFYTGQWGIPGSTDEINDLIKAMNVEMVAAKLDGTCPLGEDPLFTVTGGPIAIIEFYGRVTTLIGANVSTCQIQGKVTTPAGDVNFSTAVAIETDAPGTLYTFTAAAPGVLTPTTAGALANVPVTKWVMPPGSIVAEFSAANTGVIAWYMVYRKMSPDTVVTVAP
jgi:hypothetical protein